MGVPNFFKMVDCGPTEFFKMADLFITEGLYRPATVHEEEKGARRTTVDGTLLRPRLVLS